MAQRPSHTQPTRIWHRARSVLLGCALAALAVSALWALPAIGSQGHGGKNALPLELNGAELKRILGDEVTRRSDGLYAVRIDGGKLLTHGPDTVAAADSRDGMSEGFSPGDEERPPHCADDYHQHILYGRPAGARDRYSLVAADLRAAVRRMNAVLNRESMLTAGVSADYKVRCDASGAISVGSFTARGNDFASIVDGARDAGFEAKNADYTIFFDGIEDACGMGSYVQDERLSTENASNRGGGYAVVYRDCWFTEIPMHENAHNQGAVQPNAPDSTGSGGHCNVERDVMCYSPDGGDRRQSGTVQHCRDTIRFDCRGDDYFNPAPKPGSYLASHWNLGSRLNRFIAFGDVRAPEAMRRPCRRAKAGARMARGPHGWGDGAKARCACPKRVQRTGKAWAHGHEPSHRQRACRPARGARSGA